ncbi:MAG TPA: GNAT family protein [Azospira sp.]|nr:GNAT family protein [Azospira sp.]
MKPTGPDAPISLRPLAARDAEAIANWPAYPAEFADLDYALRPGGWLTEFGHRPDAWLYAAEHGGELVAFTLLAATAPGEAEFRIALRPDRTGQGLGAAITVATLGQGFGVLGLRRIHLLVRSNHPRAQALYQRLGFSRRGECHKVVNHRPTDFYLMDILGQSYRKPVGRDSR